MKSGGGKQKGAQYERDICKKLSLWLTRGEREDIFWRSAMSGGRATVGKKQGKDLSAQAGDLTAVHELGNKFINDFFVECKFYKDLEAARIVYGTGPGILEQFMAKAIEEAHSYQKLPLLIAKQNHKPDLAILTHNGLHTLGLNRDIPMPWNLSMLIDGTPVYIFKLEVLLENADLDFYEKINWTKE